MFASDDTHRIPIKAFKEFREGWLYIFTLTVEIQSQPTPCFFSLLLMAELSGSVPSVYNIQFLTIGIGPIGIIKYL